VTEEIIMHVRPALPTDLPTLSFLWYDQTAVQLQSDRRFSLAQDARHRWESAAAAVLHRDDLRIWVADVDTHILGYITAQIQAAPVGLLPEQIGHILELVVDLHTQRMGIGKGLLQQARVWFKSQGVEVMAAHVLHRHVVGQAFWQSQGATEWMDVLWLKL
jgi:ribosomal protein S18 acetylase RimI-like enzyme